MFIVIINHYPKKKKKINGMEEGLLTVITNMNLQNQN